MTSRNPFRISRSELPRRPALFAIAALLLASSPPAFAYLDPSTGSMVVSAIVGIFASIALAVKTYWYKIKGLFRKNRAEDAGTRESPE
jgi:hypothetical protein